MIHNTKVSIIAAIDEKRGIGKNNDLLFKIPEDLERFRQITKGRAVIMGRKTWDSLPAKPLPNRYNIVITHDAKFKVDDSREGKDFKVVGSLDEALMESIKHDASSSMYKNEENKIHNTDEVFIIGGGQIFKEALDKNLVDKLYLTIIDASFDADTFFPPYPQFKKVVFEKKGEFHGFEYKFLELEK